MNIDLIDRINYLEYLNNLNIENKILQLHKLHTIDRNIVFAIKELTSTLTINNEVDLFINYIFSLNDFFIINKYENELAICILKKDFSLLVEIALSKNGDILSFKSKNEMNLEVFYLVSYEPRYKRGSNFLLNYIEFQQTINVPLILYCDDTLIQYYEKHGFQIFSKNLHKNEYLMVYGVTNL